MKVLLAGGFSAGNLRSFWNAFSNGENIEEKMKLYLAGTNFRKSFIFDNMNVYLSDEIEKNHCKVFHNLKHINILESFYYLRKNAEFMKLVPQLGSFLLDSGAFTFMSGSHKGDINWDKYVEEYATFINRWNVDLFFELDIDSIVGLNEVERLREKLKRLTGRKPIPVWHYNRGKEYFIKMCKEYSYVALGGMAGAGDMANRKKFEKVFPWFINIAHQNNAKIHGLGYTAIKNLSQYRFDSVDSTAWLYGNRGGYLYKFNPKTGLIDTIKANFKSRLKTKEGAVHNFNEWIKLGIYAERNW